MKPFQRTQSEPVRVVIFVDIIALKIEFPARKVPVEIPPKVGKFRPTYLRFPYKKRDDFAVIEAERGHLERQAGELAREHTHKSD